MKYEINYVIYFSFIKINVKLITINNSRSTLNPFCPLMSYQTYIPIINNSIHTPARSLTSG